ncbi:MAG: ribonuclease R [Caldicoprobacterales bacterium]|jgi:ribonuclease R|nr:ribonuclease R [Clostridiales bacterium]
MIKSENQTNQLLQQKITDLLSHKDVIPLFAEQIIDVLEMSEDEENSLQEILNQMVRTGKLVQTKKKKYALPEDLGFLTGRLQGNARGFGFFISDKDEDDVFISAENLNGAMHNDRIMIRLLGSKGPSREGEVVRILERANKIVVGTFEKEKSFGFVVPDDKRIYQDIFIPRDEIKDVKNGYKVVVEMVSWPQKRRNPEGRIVEVLGHKDDVGTDILSIIRQYDLPEEFPEEVEQAARSIPQTIAEEEIKRRKDLRHLRIITMDGADAKDLDDAISITRKENGNFLLGVHIADVSHYVKENGIIDKEAYTRGTSVYLVDRVIPMLPKEISNGICSLNPNEDRLAFSVCMEIDKAGKVVSHEILESVIRSSQRMIYEDVTKILEEDDPELTERYSSYIEDLRNMETLAGILREKRMRRGSLDFDLDETNIILDLKGKPIDVKPYERGISNRIIEEFMLVCNETVAEFMSWNEMPFVYRIHEKPAVEKLLEFNEFIHNFGYHLKGIGGEIHPKSLQNLLEKIKGSREESIISTVMLRSLQKARYSNENSGHFGLAAKYYTHFTAPIRRYPDLVIHRIIKDFLNGAMSKGRIKYLEKVLPGLSEHCSQREKLADEVERETDNLKKAEYMLDKIGMEFEGIISGVTYFGIFVALANTVEGLVRMTALDDDYYVYNEKHYCLIGERTRKVYRLGDTIRVKVASVDIPSRNIDFILA